MSSDSNNDSRIDAVLNSLDGVRQAKAPDFLYTRLQGRMEREFDQGGPLGRWLTKPVLALTIAAIILIANATTVLKMWEQNTSTTNVNNESGQIVAAEYPAGGVYPVYNENSLEP
ncbi:hypothetical protein A4H97_27685 [Niastella yeongjuensis]|uniref:Uncharacterized protein n=1 Tax=Niastella yeongjuensis TaxID=354355 RepID=A0A1V9EZ95_9BACT|nr:hypothetical protein [Niastella yeongjuensis]OQP51359.1 hypothetical protein A4H97_27685 [Niastella yeongjuensis]SEP38374.1 hypothetical protein SAMN05660816_05617 [Niastella yeongjuensis]